MGEWILPEVKQEIEARQASRKLNQEQEVIESRISVSPNYVLIDGALWEDDLYIAKQKNILYRSLYRGTMSEQLDSIAPYLFSLEQNGEFEKWIKEQDPIKRRVTWIHSSSNIDALRKHLRRFLRMKTELGSYIYFRFYDPYVIDYTLPCFTREQLMEFFKEINYIRVQDTRADEDTVFYILEAAGLQIDRKALCGQ
ncbi:DUF4123 domain-containing protein [Prevotella sp. 10(H)]|uniref:DUF4123 domain-containing protein n=1 Tax=Prevotella sp. 10(H) TaxID=1158294 RepID=UPI0004A6FDCE|nr:DUF4123 domain-containing protein [Prevotella sp. 10(H)]